MPEHPGKNKKNFTVSITIFLLSVLVACSANNNAKIGKIERIDVVINEAGKKQDSSVNGQSSAQRDTNKQETSLQATSEEVRKLVQEKLPQVLSGRHMRKKSRSQQNGDRSFGKSSQETSLASQGIYSPPPMFADKLSQFGKKGSQISDVPPTTTMRTEQDKGYIPPEMYADSGNETNKASVFNQQQDQEDSRLQTPVRKKQDTAQEKSGIATPDLTNLMPQRTPDIAPNLLEASAKFEEDPDNIFADRDKIDIKQAIQNAFKSAPGLEKAQAQVREAIANRKEIYADSKPQLSSFSNFSFDDRSNDSDDDGFTLESGLQVDYQIYNFGASQKRLASGDLSVKSRKIRLRDTYENLAFQVVQSFMDVYRLRRHLELDIHQRDKFKEFLEQTKQAWEAGLALKSQLEQARAGMVKRRQSVQNRREQLRKAEASFQRLTKINPEKHRFLNPNVNEISLPQSREQFIDEILPNVLSLEALRKAVESAKKEKMALIRQKYGNISVNGNVSLFRELDGSSTGLDNSTDVMLEYTVPLYDAGVQKSRLQRAKADLARARSDLKEARGNVKERLRNMYNSANSTEKMIRLAQKEKKHEKQILKAFRGEAEQGARGFNDIVSQINAVRSAQKRLIAAKVSRILAEYSIKRHRGKLLDSFDIIPRPMKKIKKERNINNEAIE